MAGSGVNIAAEFRDLVAQGLSGRTLYEKEKRPSLFHFSADNRLAAGPVWLFSYDAW